MTQPLTFTDITAGTRLTGIVVGEGSAGIVTVVAISRHGRGSATLTYRTSQGQLGERIITANDLAGVFTAHRRRWSFDADGEMFRLASEARRMRLAHLSDPFAAVDTSNIEPYPHQIDAVYNRLLVQKPLRFVLADDPGAGKTIMAGLLIRELMLRGDVARCLIVAPGSLVEQWQDELWDKFSLSFDLMSRAAVEASRAGNPFLEKHLLVARLDQLARAEDLQAKLKVADWDLVIIDEAHKMSARPYGRKINKTGRFKLGEMLRELTRHLLLLTATPHNGRNEDFLAFMTLVDPDRFAGAHRGNGNRSASLPDTSDVMRRIVKENLRTFKGKPLFPKRTAESLNFDLSEREKGLYEAVTGYVRTGMNRAQQMQDEGQRGRGIIVGFALVSLQRRLASSPAAIYHSLRRRSERLSEQAKTLRELAKSGEQIPLFELPRGIKPQDLKDFDYDDYDDEFLEELEDRTIDAATASATAEEIEVEVEELKGLVGLAEEVRRSGTDTKWIQLRDLLRTNQMGSRTADRKLIIFTEYKDTLDYVAERVKAELGRPEAVAVIHGGVKRHDRRRIQDMFRVDPTVRILVATDAAGEGVNLQVANMMVNYDLPWNPNRIEQRFGRIHRIGQALPCHLWNMVAHETREGKVFTKLFRKIEEQRNVYGEQVYDVLGDLHINTSLRELLMRSIQEDSDPAHFEYMNQVIDDDIGAQMRKVLDERALVRGLSEETSNEAIRNLMERSRARKLQPWFVEAFFSAALKHYGGRLAAREKGRYEVTRVPASVRSSADETLGPVHERYSRVTFNKAFVKPQFENEGVLKLRAGADGSRKGGGKSERAVLISPGTALLSAVVGKVLADHEDTLEQGAILIDPDRFSTNPRLLVYLDHVITDGRQGSRPNQAVSRRFQYAEIDEQGIVSDPGPEPYIGYLPADEEQRAALERHLNLDWVDSTAETTARDWAIENMAGEHFREIEEITEARVAKVRSAVQERLIWEIRYWDDRAIDLKEQERQGKTPSVNSAQASKRAEELVERLARRRLELDQERNLHNTPPNIVGAALVVPQGRLDEITAVEDGKEMPVKPDPEVAEDTDRRAVAAVLESERLLGREPEAQEHSNPGYDVLSIDPATGDHYFIEVKGHLPQTTEIHVSAQQVQKAKSNPERWRLAVVSVPESPETAPVVRYLVEPFQDVTMHFAQTRLTLNVEELLQSAVDPR